MWGIIPAAGAGSRIQPLAFSKELLPVGSSIEDGRERPRAVSEPLIHLDETVLIGLPDTIWKPEDGFAGLPHDVLSLLLFPVDQPEIFDAVVTDDDNVVQEIQVKQKDARSNWIWGGMRMPGRVFHQLHALWQRADRRDEYLGTLLNAWIGQGGRAIGMRTGEAYVDVGTLDGYRKAIALLASEAENQQVLEKGFEWTERKPC